MKISNVTNFSADVAWRLIILQLISGSFKILNTKYELFGFFEILLFNMGRTLKMSNLFQQFLIGQSPSLPKKEGLTKSSVITNYLELPRVPACTHGYPRVPAGYHRLSPITLDFA